MERRITWDELPTALKRAIQACTAPAAERQASRLPAFQAADPARVDLFAVANIRVWDEIMQSNQSPWTIRMVQAARSWAACRRAR